MKLPYKAKQYLWAVLKLLVLSGVVYFIIRRLSSQPMETWQQLIRSLTQYSIERTLWIIVAVVLWIFNWFFDIKKWQLLVRQWQVISFKQAAIETFSALTVGQLTPAKIGEYGVRPLYYPLQLQKRMIANTFISNTLQMVMTVAFGTIGLAFVIIQYTDSVAVYSIAIIALIILGIVITFYLVKEKKIKGISLGVLINYIKQTKRSILRNVTVLSFLKYISFSLLFYFVLLIMGSQIEFFPSMLLIFAMYLCSSILPTFIVLDVVVKGGVALWIFSLISIPEPITLATVLVMWLLNFVLPALLGSYFIAIFKPKTA